MRISIPQKSHKQWGARLLCLGLLSLLACNSDKESAGVHQASPRGGQGVKPLVQIRQAQNLFELAALKKNLKAKGEITPTVEEAIADKQQRLVKNIKPKAELTPEIDLLDFDYKRTGKDTFRVFVALKIKKDLKGRLGKNVLVYMRGYVDDYHAKFLSKNNKQKDVGYFSAWRFRPDPPVSQWRAGAIIILEHQIKAQPIPYKMRLYLVQTKPKWKRLSTIAQLGWYVDL